MTLITDLQPGLFNLVLVDKTKPIILNVQIQLSLSPANVAACQTEYNNNPSELPHVIIKDTSGNILKQWSLGSSDLDSAVKNSTPMSLIVNQDISSLLSGLEIVDIEFGASPCEANETVTPVVITASLNYTNLPYNNTNVQSLSIPGYYWGIGIDAWPGSNLDLSLWDGKSSVILKTILTSNDGYLKLYINNQLVASSDSNLSETQNIDQDISAYVKQGINSISIFSNPYHSNPIDFVDNLGFSTMVFLFNSAAPIPIITANASVQNNEVHDVNGITSVISGELSVFADKAQSIVVDTKGLASPSIITIPDATQETKIPISITLQKDVQSFSIDFYLLVEGKQYFLQTQSFNLDVSVTDFRPTISIIDTKLYVTQNADNFIGTIITSFQVDNTKWTKPVSISTEMAFFGQSNGSFSVPAGAIMVAEIEHSFVGSIAAVNSTAIGISIICAGTDGPSVSIDPPANNILTIASPPALSQPTFSTPGGGVITPSPPSSSGQGTQAIVLSKTEIIMLVGVAAGGAIIFVTSLFSRKHKSS